MLSTPRCCTSLAAPMHRTVTSQPQSNLHARSRVSHCALPPAFIDLADLLQEPTIKIAAPAGLALLGAGASVLAARAAVYARLQYVLASLLGTRVPSGTTTVLQLGGSARDLYYLPNGVQRVTVVDPAAKAGWSKQRPIRRSNTHAYHRVLGASWHGGWCASGAAYTGASDAAVCPGCQCGGGGGNYTAGRMFRPATTCW